MSSPPFRAGRGSPDVGTSQEPGLTGALPGDSGGRRGRHRARGRRNPRQPPGAAAETQAPGTEYSDPATTRPRPGGTTADGYSPPGTAGAGYPAAGARNPPPGRNRAGYPEPGGYPAPPEGSHPQPGGYPAPPEGSHPQPGGYPALPEGSYPQPGGRYPARADGLAGRSRPGMVPQGEAGGYPLPSETVAQPRPRPGGESFRPASSPPPGEAGAARYPPPGRMSPGSPGNAGSTQQGYPPPGTAAGTRRGTAGYSPPGTDGYPPQGGAASTQPATGHNPPARPAGYAEPDGPAYRQGGEGGYSVADRTAYSQPDPAASRPDGPPYRPQNAAGYSRPRTGSYPKPGTPAHAQPAQPAHPQRGAAGYAEPGMAADPQSAGPAHRPRQYTASYPADPGYPAEGPYAPSDPTRPLRAIPGGARPARPPPTAAHSGQVRRLRPVPPGEQAGPGLARSSAVVAIGTLASRVTGLLRTLVLAYAIGVSFLANAYNYANTLPNAVYNLAIGGILTSVIVPLLVNAAKRDTDGGEAYDQRIVTMITGVLLAITVAATLAAAPIAGLYDPHARAADHAVLVVFAYFFIPQIFFYGMTSLAGAVLNSRNHFAAPAWTPVVNNIVVIAVSLAFIVIAGVHRTPQNITGFQLGFLAVGTTLGIVAQTVALVPALRSVGFRWRPRFDFRRAEISHIGRTAGWMFCYVATTQVAFLVTSRVASAAQGPRGWSAYTNAWLLFQLPYAIVGISVITALLPRMSAHATDRRYDLLRADFSAGVRLGSVIVAPAALVLAVLGPSLAEVLLGWGATSSADARYLGLVFSVFSLGLIPYMLFQLQLRVFYALHDTRTPAVIGGITMVANIAANLLAAALLPPGQVVAALGAGFGVANTVGVIVSWRVLSRRLRGLAGREIGGSLLRMHAAAIPAAIFALEVTVMARAVLPAGKPAALAIVAVGGGGALLLYHVFARATGTVELAELTDVIRSRLRR
jgi:putative peptidoglycan lipid II flippase